MHSKHLSFFTLLLLISFASVNAVLYTPALPEIAHFFAISAHHAELTITWFLIGYTLGQLIYGPLANRYGRKPALYVGILMQILSCFICVYSAIAHQYLFLVIGRFLLALGSGVGLKMTFTLVNEVYEPKVASQKISYLMLAFAITPALGIAIGGFLTSHYGWVSCFYAEAVYGFLLLFLVMRLPETQTVLDKDALQLSHLAQGYGNQFRNRRIINSGFLMGCSTAFIYIFAALAPFIAINLFGMSSADYGVANLLPAVGLILGSLTSAQLVKKFELSKIILAGILMTVPGVVLMLLGITLNFSTIYALFFPMVIIYFGLSLVIANSSTLAMSHTQDKAHGSAVMNFINMGVATTAVLSVGLLPVLKITLPLVYVFLSVGMLGLIVRK